MSALSHAAPCAGTNASFPQSLATGPRSREGWQGDTSTYSLRVGGSKVNSAASLERAEAEQLAHSDQTQTPNGGEQKATSVWISVSESKVAAEG